jgi:hypothetical protein
MKRKDGRFAEENKLATPLRGAKQQPGFHRADTCARASLIFLRKRGQVKRSAWLMFN